MRRIGALAGVVAMVLWTSPLATAQPLGDIGVSGEAATMSLSDLGGSGTVAFFLHRDNITTSMTFPVPPGLAPVALRATVEIPVRLRFGNLTVSQNGRTISRVSLPTQDQADIVIPLKDVEVSGGWVNLTLGLTAIPVDPYCWDDDAPLRLVDIAATFTGGVAVPTSVANFLPPVLRKVTIGMPPKPSPAESDAAVQVAAAIATHNGQSPVVVVVPLPAGKTALDAPAAPLERQIVVKEGGEKGLSLQGSGVPSLLISGAGKDLADQARLLSSASLPFATSAKAVADDLPEQELLSDNTTVADVTRSGDLTNNALWPRVGIDLDQTRFGHPLAGFRVHLLGSHTPMPRDFGGEVTVSIGDKVIDRWAATPDGVIDRTVTVPDKLLKRFVTLEVAVHTTGDPGHCGDYLPVALRIDGESTIQARPANPPVPQGIQGFPQALMPTVQFGIGPDTFGDTVRAAQIAVGLQRMSGIPLTTEVATLREAIGSGGSAVLISPDGFDDPSVTLPFNTEGGKLTVQGVDPQGQSASLTLDPEVKFGSLQTVFDGQRSLLIASSNGAPGQLDSLLNWLTSRWGGLNGRAVVSVPGAEPLTIANPPVIESAEAAPQQSNVFWWVAGGVAAIAAVGAALILLRARRHGRT
jgi:hypothetical protein